MWDTAESRYFRNSIRSYNSAFAFASLGLNEDMLPAGVYCFRVSGTVCHRIGHLQPNTDGERPKFAQLYIYDTENEVQNRLHWNQHLKPDALHTISSVINGVNPFVKFYKHAANQIEQAGDQGNSIKMVLRADASKDSRRYNLPTASELSFSNLIQKPSSLRFTMNSMKITLKKNTCPKEQF